MNRYLKNFAALFYPPLCAACGVALYGGESALCLHCQHHLPRTHYAFQTDNKVEKLFWGKIHLEHGSSYLLFQKKGKVQHLIHHIKYKGHKETAEILGHYYGTELKESGNYRGLGMIIPVPLHKSKLRRRGYNQSEWIAKGMAKAMGVSLNTDSLMRIQKANSQTTKSTLGRWANIQQAFAVKNAGSLSGHHILLVDDVITTGATLHACASSLLQSAKNIKISIASLAVAME